MARSAGVSRKLGINDKVFVLVDSVLLTGLGRIALMPALVLAAKVCPEVKAIALTFLCTSCCLQDSPLDQCAPSLML